MRVLETILHFLLSVGQLFFRGRRRGDDKNGRQRCPRCGALLRADSPCGCRNPPDGNSPGGSRSDPDMDPGEAPPSSLTSTTLLGWALIVIALGRLF